MLYHYRFILTTSIVMIPVIFLCKFFKSFQHLIKSRKVRTWIISEYWITSINITHNPILPINQKARITSRSSKPGFSYLTNIDLSRLVFNLWFIFCYSILFNGLMYKILICTRIQLIERKKIVWLNLSKIKALITDRIY